MEVGTAFALGRAIYTKGPVEQISQITRQAKKSRPEGRLSIPAFIAFLGIQTPLSQRLMKKRCDQSIAR